MTIIPISSSERWDEEAKKVKAGKGKWVIVGYESKRDRNSKVKEALERRGLNVEVTSRIGHGTAERPWNGWRTWARTI
jgi:hypothetical protein